MDCKNGDIYQFNDAEFKALQEEGAKLAPLSKKQYGVLEPLDRIVRKNYMRNQPCVCGSGKKFKRCCWNQYA